MNCPQCHTALVMSERQGVEIDYCPQCRGVWLDRGELDKIIDRAGREDDDGHRATTPPPRNDRYDNDDDDHRHRGHHHKKKSFWSELFD
jgi:uncharacterized protein